MEEPLLWTGSLNNADSNLPNGDYSDARNIVIVEDDQGGGGSFKKMRSITAWKDLSEFGAGVGIVASEIDPDGNQYFLVHSNAIKEVSVSITSFPASAAGQLVTQAGGARGYIYGPQLGAPATSTAYILQTSTTNFANGTFVIDGDNYTGASTSVGAAISVAFLVKVDTAAVATVLFAYELTETPSVDPDLVIIGDNLVWNYLYGGVPMSFYVPRRFYYATEDGASGYSYEDAFLIKSPPQGVTLDSTDALDNGFRYIFKNHTHVIAARFVFDSGEVSVLSTPITIAANQKSDLSGGDDDFDSITLTIQGDTPPTAQSIEWYASRDSGPFRRVATLPTSGTTDLTFTGELNESLSTTESSKFFDAVPISINAIESIKNRLFLANMVDDLPNETADVTLTITPGVAADDFSGSTGYAYAASDGNAATFVEKALTNNSVYRFGVIFMDDKFRTRGVVESSIVDFTTSSFSTTNNRVKSISMDINTAPSWAKYAQIVFSKNLTKDFSIESYANGVFYQLENTETRALFLSNSGIGTEDIVFGQWNTGFRINKIVVDPGISYSFQSGDVLSLAGDDGSMVDLKITSVVDGLIYCDPDDNVQLARVGSESNYIEIHSPKSQLSEELSFFYETGHIVKIADAGSPHVFYEGGATNNFGKRVFDQYWQEIEVREPNFNKHVDTSREYTYNGSEISGGQKGIPLFNNGAAIIARSDITETSGTGVGNGFISFNGLHTNDPSNTISDVYAVGYLAHGHKAGDVVQMDSAGAGADDNQYILRVLDEDRYIAQIACLGIEVSSTVGFSEGDAVTIQTSKGEATGILVYVQTSGPATDMYISGMTVKFAHLGAGNYSSISNGTTTKEIVALVSYTPPFDSAYGTALSTGEGYSGRVLYSEDKLYACGFATGVSVFNGLTLTNMSPRFPGDLSTFDSAGTINYKNSGNGQINAIALPYTPLEDEAKYLVEYKISAYADVGNTEDVTIQIDEYSHGLNLIIISADAISLAPGESRVMSGILRFDTALIRAACIILPYITSTSGGQTVTIREGSFMHVEFEDDYDEMTYSPSSVVTAVARQPNLRPEDDFTWDRPYGRPMIVDSGREPKVLETKIRWGQRFIEDALLNPISSFTSTDQDFTPKETGAITSIVRTSKSGEIGSVLLAIGERGANSIYVGERVLTNNDGTENVVATDSVVGSIQPLVGSYGTNHKKSISKDVSGSVAWWDDFNRSVIRYTRGGLLAISDFKMKPYFRSKSGEFVSFYDKFHDMFFFSNATADETASFSQGELIAQQDSAGWRSFHDFVITLGGEQFNDYSFPIKGAIVYRTLGSSFGSYFGETSQAYMTLSKFSSDNFDLFSIRMRGNLIDLTDYSVREVDVVITNDLGQQTSMDEGYFVIEGSYIYTDIYRDENSDGGAAEGIPLIASNANVKVMLGTDSTISQSVAEVYLNVNPSAS